MDENPLSNRVFGTCINYTSVFQTQMMRSIITVESRRVRSSYCTIGNADSPGPGVNPTGQFHLKRPVPASPPFLSSPGPYVRITIQLCLKRKVPASHQILGSPGPGVNPTGQFHLKRPVTASRFISNTTRRVQHPARSHRKVSVLRRLQKATPGRAPSCYTDEIRVLEYHEVLPDPPDGALEPRREIAVRDPRSGGDGEHQGPSQIALRRSGVHLGGIEPRPSGSSPDLDGPRLLHYLHVIRKIAIADPKCSHDAPVVVSRCPQQVHVYPPSGLVLEHAVYQLVEGSPHILTVPPCCSFLIL